MQPGHEKIETEKHHLAMVHGKHQVGAGIEPDLELVPPFKILVDHKDGGTHERDEEKEHGKLVVPFLHGRDRHGHGGAADQQHKGVNCTNKCVQVVGSRMKIGGITASHHSINQE